MFEFFVALFGSAYYANKIFGEQAKKTAYAAAVNNMEHWRIKVTNELLERELLFGLTDDPDNYSAELEEACSEIEKLYFELIMPVYNEYVNNAALRGEDKREYWAEKMLINADSSAMDIYLKTNINMARILLAKRGYLRREDAYKGSYMNLSYSHPVDGAVLKWCADRLSEQGVPGVFAMRDMFGTGYGKNYSPAQNRIFQLRFSNSNIGWVLSP